ncbi:MAG: VWA domain-containing protein [Rhodopirellula sp.]|nr:VWA domain-containing protein [Rhodopirellula sp.]
MGRSRQVDLPRERESGLVGVRPRAPSWLLSLLLHVAILVVLGLTLQVAPRQGAMAERTADVGIVLKHQGGGEEFFEGPSGGESAEKATSEASRPSDRSLEEILDDQPPVDPTAALPAAMAIIGPAVAEGGGVGDAGAAGKGPRGPVNGIGGGTKATTSLFGVQGEGNKFVYVFDRSGSMGGSGRNALGMAKTALASSLESLDTVHQFQIIFYNEKPVIFNPSGQPGKLALATEQNKERARRFIGSITPDGGTRHENALKMAISLQPDVIFLLTDADEPRLSTGQLEQVHRWANGISINTIEFGLGPKMGGDNFLMRLARENGGRYGYVDISRPFPQEGG